MSKVVIFGTSDFAQIVSVYLTQDSPHEIIAFTVNQQYLTRQEFMGRQVFPFEEIEQRFAPDEIEMFVAIGFKGVNKARAKVYEQCKQKGYRMISYICSKATHWGHINVGENTFIFENNVIQPFVGIGNNVIIWSGNHIGHHSTIEDHVFIASHTVISGRVTIGHHTFVGVNATFRDGVKIAPECVIGAGATILKDTIERGVYKSVNTELAPFRSDELLNF